jgi:hypothetical protein
MATVKSTEKSKTSKKSQIKTTKKSRVSKAKKIMDAQPVPAVPVLIPITPEFEEKMTRRYYEMEKYLRGITYGAPVFTLYLLYLIIKSKGEVLMILNFLGFVVITIGWAYCSHLFTKQSKKSIMVYAATITLLALHIILISWITNSDKLIAGSIIGYIIMILLWIEMLRLKKYNFLY